MDTATANPTTLASPRRGTPWLHGLCALLILALLLAWGWLDVRARAIPATGPQGQKTDLVVYLAAGSALRAGQDIYEARNVRGWPYLYPPLAALVFVPLADLPRGQAAYIWFLMSLGCFAGCVLAMRAALRRVTAGGGTGGTVLVMRGALRQSYARWAGRAAVLGVLPVALPMLHTLQRGQINALPLLLVCLAIYALARRWDLLAGMSLAMAAAIKVTPGLAAGYFLWKWTQHQVRAIRSGTWRPATLLERTQALAGFALGLVLGLLVIPGLYMGPRQAATALATWRAKVASGYMTGDSTGQVFRDTRAIHDTSDRNQTWYRVALSTVWLYDHQALSSRDQLQPAWQNSVWWLLLGTGVTLAAILAWASRSERTQPDSLAPCAELAAFVWLAISFGKIAWAHYYVLVYPVMAIAWLVARRHAGTPGGRALTWMFRLMVLACLLHYGLSRPDEPAEPARTRAQRAARKVQAASPHDLGGLLLPAGVLALATVIVANRRCDAADCTQL